MANQIQATVYQIDGSPLSEPKQISFLTSDILMRPNSILTTPEVLSSITYYPNTSNQLQEQTFYVSESLGDLVTASNTGGTTQLVATVFEINGDPIPGGLYFSFPADAVAISAIINAEPIQASIQFKNKRYSVSDSLSSLVSAANVGVSGYKVYTAIVDANFVPTILENTLGTLNFLDYGGGSYVITSDGLFTLNKSVAFFGIISNEYITKIEAVFNSESNFVINSYGAIPTLNSIFPIEIRVYQ
jgi:hypothetical protein